MDYMLVFQMKRTKILSRKNVDVNENENLFNIDIN